MVKKTEARHMRIGARARAPRRSNKSDDAASEESVATRGSQIPRTGNFEKNQAVRPQRSEERVLNLGDLATA